MNQSVVINFSEGSCQSGFSTVVAQLWENNRSLKTQWTGSLPPALNLLELYQKWRSLYPVMYDACGWRQSEIEFEDEEVTQVSEAEFKAICQRLRTGLNQWLNSGSFGRIERQMRTYLTPDQQIRIIIQSEDTQLRRFPWHLWNFFLDYPDAELALSIQQFQPPIPKPRSRKKKVRLLAILGNSQGIDIQTDRQLLQQLPQTETVFLVEPQRSELDRWLWDEQGWDILFFAGHSFSQAGDTTGKLEINPQESIAIEQLKNALKAAIRQGLQLAIFNSCDGLGLARQLADLQIPQLIVMRESVPDGVAQAFLTHFLPTFASGKSFYLSVREAREKLEGLESQFPCAGWLPVICQNPATIAPNWRQLRDGIKPEKILPKVNLSPTILFTGASLTASLFVIIIRFLGILQPFELKAFDHFMLSRPDEGMDSRLLLITITGSDVQAQPPKERQATSLSNRALEQLIEKLTEYQPRVIGLDIYREMPTESEYKTLINSWQNSDRLIGVCKIGDDAENPGIPAPQEILKDNLRERVGFSNTAIDPDNIVRRQLIGQAYPQYSLCQVDTSLNFRLALRYLGDEGITDEITTSGNIKIGEAIFLPVEQNSGGYRSIDARGYQFLINYRAGKQIAPRLTLAEVLVENRLTPELVKDRIVLIGTTDKTFKDFHRTPLSQGDFPDIPGVVIQAHMVSQIVSAVKDKRPLIWWWPEWIELLWILAWSGLAAFEVWKLNSPKILIFAIVGSLIFMYSSCFVMLWIFGGWIPFVPSAIAFISTITLIIIIRRLFKPEINR
ncbi:CHASE2 domain-containing protein [Capilliphycus salinus ALCB114379]|uniref:CHASE2 domain-containing protein n=1 Tax=Capilliphycus salinus TaxID=2768948 RepID=UPI0039A62B64